MTWAFIQLLIGRAIIWGVITWIVLTQWRQRRLWGATVLQKVILNLSGAILIFFYATTPLRIEMVDVWRGPISIVLGLFVLMLVLIIRAQRVRLRYYIAKYNERVSEDIT